MDKSLIIKRISERYNLASKGDIAKFLGVSPQTLSNWLCRNTIDFDIIFTKCENVNLNWLLTGRGEMILEKNGYLNGYPNGYLSPNVSKNDASAADKSEPTIIYKRDPRDVEIIELLRSKVELLEDKVVARDEKIAALKGGGDYIEYGAVDIGASDPAAATPMPIIPRRNGDNVTH